MYIYIFSFFSFYICFCMYCVLSLWQNVIHFIISRRCIVSSRLLLDGCVNLCLLPDPWTQYFKNSELILIPVGTSVLLGKGMTNWTLGSRGQSSRSHETKDKFKNDGGIVLCISTIVAWWVEYRNESFIRQMKRQTRQRDKNTERTILQKNIYIILQKQ